jgi:hypothetical protein
MTPQRPQRVRKPKVIWEAVEDTKLSTAKKAVEKAPRTIRKQPSNLSPLNLFHHLSSALFPYTRHRLKYAKNWPAYVL